MKMSDGDESVYVTNDEVPVGLDSCYMETLDKILTVLCEIRDRLPNKYQETENQIASGNNQ